MDHQPSDQDRDDLALIVGHKAIAETINLKPSQFNESRRKGGMGFVWKEPGLGLVTTRQAARDYFNARINGGISTTSRPLDKPA